MCSCDALSFAHDGWLATRCSLCSRTICKPLQEPSAAKERQSKSRVDDDVDDEDEDCKKIHTRSRRIKQSRYTCAHGNEENEHLFQIFAKKGSKQEKILHDTMAVKVVVGSSNSRVK